MSDYDDGVFQVLTPGYTHCKSIEELSRAMDANAECEVRHENGTQYFRGPSTDWCWFKVKEQR